MKRSVIFLVAAAFILAAPAIQPAFAADDTPKVEKAGKTGSSAETKMMNKQDKTPKVKTQGNGAVKEKVKTGADAKGGDDVTLKKGGKTTNAVK
jgi:hypothetical protein